MPVAMTMFVTALSPRRPEPRRVATGRIEGTVVLSSSLSARRSPVFRIYADPGSGAQPPIPPSAKGDPTTAELHNVVIYLEGDSATLATAPGHGDVPEPALAARPARVTMAQHDESFVPHVLAVVRGTTVDFPNEDDVYHNVFSLSHAAPNGGFDLGRYPKGESKSETFDRTGTVQVFCHIHSDMSAVVLVLSNPFFTSPGDDHHFVIDGVPAGDYTIVGWHERIKPIAHHVHVTAGQTTTVAFNIPVPPGGTGPGDRP